MRARWTRAVSLALAAGVALTVPAATAAENQDEGRPHYVRPGAPGEPSVRIDPREIAVVPSEPLSEHEVHFLQMMIPHHGQAVVMSDMVPDRHQDPRVLNLAFNIDRVQAGEIEQMSDILRDHGEDVPDPDDHEHHHDMPGMLTPEQLAHLRSLEGRAFDKQFLEFMVYHHWGAIIMAQDLMHHTHNVMNSNVSDLVTHIESGQWGEIMYMESLLREYENDG